MKIKSSLKSVKKRDLTGAIGQINTEVINRANPIEAAQAGTKMHRDIELFYNNEPIDNTSIEFSYFKNFYEDFPELKPYRTEWVVYHEEYDIAGSIDMIYKNEDGTLSIYDWKRSKQISKTSPWSKYALTECIDHLPDTNFWHYALQLNTYKALLEKNYGKTVTKMALVCLHPNQKRYQVIAVPNLQNEVRDLFELRKTTMVVLN